MAPEIMLEGRVSKAADVYAFGITMWELFTGGHAFQGTHTLSTRTPARVADGWLSDLAATVTGCLVKD